MKIQCYAVASAMAFSAMQAETARALSLQTSTPAFSEDDCDTFDSNASRLVQVDGQVALLGENCAEVESQLEKNISDQISLKEIHDDVAAEIVKRAEKALCASNEQ
mmetsp:Transcript_9127/g.12413  ORF Transcript_9127/g.12413 Transcript_9127/m.12413 type:complete len:106 (-) Transcript_9127:126-443(-)|eukprot:CAMPEP_0185567614 /NCGR_PEP_ID=MMETSP0434-20130131/830_1 /TAXON_ID=626734 ORGANISM="Favella taraikaensis, Strain Fe Narragansett Bay" /NCGR_SAMPLE_ID=MMETSP0434 /ASSEMBLY_ACC=CAM_ASM_000379 /LENGTH=105 /DNA_ID=CAMNT_0028181881 /DNA_START=6 /DNA_END=323 /DNA_ORIENTATION=+